MAKSDGGADDGDALVARGGVDEAAVELDLVDRELAKAGQRRQTGAEIVERDPEALLAKRLDRSTAQGAMFDEQFLGDLELDLARLHLFLGADRQQIVDEIRVAELERRQIEGDRKLRPAARGPAGVAKSAHAKLADDAAFLGDRDHVQGRHFAEHGMGPAKQAFEADDLAAGADHRLEVEVHRIAGGELGADRAFDLVTALDVGVHRLGEDPEAVAAGRLGAVHRDVGLAHQLGGFADFAGGEDGADADSDPGLALAQHERLADDGDDPLAQAADIGLAFGADLDDRELVAADPGDGVGLADQGMEALADLLDEPVAGIVAQSVVDLLEAIEIEHQQGDLLAAPAVAGQGLAQAVLEQGAVGEAGELIVERLVLGRGLALLELADQFDDRAVEEGHDQDDRDRRGQGDRPDQFEQFDARRPRLADDRHHREIGQYQGRHRRRNDWRPDLARIAQRESPLTRPATTSLWVNKSLGVLGGTGGDNHGVRRFAPPFLGSREAAKDAKALRGLRLGHSSRSG